MHSTSSEAMVSNSIQTRHAIVPTVGPQKGVLLLTANPFHPDVRLANPTAVGLLFKANERCTCHATPS
jgi:hypothetical protein